MTTTASQLTFHREMKDGRVLAINAWNTGSQWLVFPNRAAFDRAKLEAETTGNPIPVAGFTPA